MTPRPEHPAATPESYEQREERWIDWTSRPYQFVPLNLYDETQKLSEIAVGEMLAEIERLRSKLAEYDKYVGEFTNNA